MTVVLKDVLKDFLEVAVFDVFVLDVVLHIVLYIALDVVLDSPVAV